MATESVSLQALAPRQGPLAAQFKAAMRRFAVSVSIITIADETAKFGMTATAVSSVSTDPPSLLVCINRSARIHAEMRSGRAFCVNVLNDDQAALSNAFGGRFPAEQRFSLGGWIDEDGRPPYLSDAQANVFCVIDTLLEYGTHTIFIGKVEAVRLHGEFQPLVYADARYFSVLPVPSTPSGPELTWL